MPTVKDFVESIGGICGAEKDVIVTFRNETKDMAVNNIIKRSTIKKSVSDYMFELEFEGVTFRVFVSGRAVFRSIKNKKTLNKILSALLL
jgi:hypothetical protein